MDQAVPHPKEEVSDTKFPIVIKDGKKYVDPYASDARLSGKYLVRHYPLPELDDLKAFRAMIKDFEQRFLHFVDRGYSVTKTPHDKLDQYIDQERANVEREAARLIKEGIKTPEGIIDNAKLELSKRWLATALTGQAMRLAKYHLKLREAIPETEQEKLAHGERLNQIYIRTSSAAMEVLNLDVKLRGKRGYPDEDTVIAEMMGEPSKLFLASLSGDKENIKDFFDGRYTKVAQAMRNIDTIVEAVAPLMPQRVAFKDKINTSRATPDLSKFRDTFKIMAEAAKTKIQVQHGDADYADADKTYIAVRDLMQEMIRNRQKEIAAVSTSEPTTRLKERFDSNIAAEERALNCLVKATNLIYDVAVTRDEHKFSLELLKREVKASDIHGTSVTQRK